MKHPGERLKKLLRATLPKALRTAWWLISIMVPVSLAVTLLGYTQVLQTISGWLNPFFHFMGLSGQSALVFLTGIFLNIYSAIAVMTSLPLTMREVTILALMCLISHNLIVEIIILKKTGSSATEMTLLRLFFSVIGAIGLNLLLPADNRLVSNIAEAIPGETQFLPLMKTWFISTFYLCLKVVVLVSALMVLQRILEEFGIMEVMAKMLAPFLRLMGLPARGSFLWIVANVVGLGFGSALMMDYLERQRITLKENDLVNHHIAICHSLLEDTLLFVAIGVSAFWITVPRLVLAIISVWGYRLIVKTYRLIRNG